MTAVPLGHIALCAALGWVAAGPEGLVVGLAVSVAAAAAPRVTAFAAIVVPLLMMAATVAEGSLDVGRIRAFPADRPLAHRLGLATVVIWVAIALRTWQRGRGAPDDVPLAAPETGDDEQRPRTRRDLVTLGVLIVAALVGTARVLA